MDSPNEIKTIFWNERSTFDRVHGAMFHNELARLGIRTGGALYANTVSGESALTIKADSYAQIDQARKMLESYKVVVSEVEALPARALPQRTLADAIFTIPRAARSNFGHRQEILSNKYLDVLLHSVLLSACVTRLDNGSSEEALLERSKEAGLYINHWDTQSDAKNRWSIMLPMGTLPNTFPEVARSAGVVSVPAWRSEHIWNPAADHLHRMAQRIFRGFNPHDIEDAVQWALEDLFYRIRAAAASSKMVVESDLAEDLRLFTMRVKWRLLDTKRTSKRRNNVPLNDLESIPGLITPFDFAVLGEAREVLDAELPAWSAALKPAERDRVQRRARGETFEAIAIARAEPIGTVKASVSRALAKLQTRLQDRTGVTIHSHALNEALTDSTCFYEEDDTKTKNN